MKWVLFALLTLPCFADTITYTTSLSDSGSFSGALSTFNETLTVPQFDPNLGTLDLARFSLRLGGSFSWDMDRITQQGLWDFAAHTDLTFLGLSMGPWTEYSYGGIGGCGTAQTSDCPIMHGTIASQGISIYKALPNNLGQYVGSAMLDLPALITFTPYLKDPSSETGTLMPYRTVSMSLAWYYDYTPASDIQELSEVVSTPEPSTIPVLGLIVGLWIARSWSTRAAAGKRYAQNS